MVERIDLLDLLFRGGSELMAAFDFSITNRKTLAPRTYRVHSGYGAKIPTSHMIQVNYGKRWYRVYCTNYANSGVCWVVYRGNKINIRDTDLLRFT